MKRPFPKRVSRRTLLATAGKAAAAGLASSSTFTIAAERSRGANERPGVGFIGTGGRAGAHIDICLTFQKQGRCDTVAVCDVYG
ncbi:MAG: hypothetical protein NUV77_18755, partial [Thermoguttaceae bacterium]|nr:hypothetical protein [Thermoguttaceae bacterium]